MTTRSRPGEVLRYARQASGLTARALAKLAGVAASSITEAERGRDARLETLRSVVGRLPGLDAAELLGQGAGPRPASFRAWMFFARALGFEARLLRLTATVTDQGPGPSTLEVEGLRPARRSLLETDVREALMQAACEASGAVMRALEARDSDLAGVTQRLEEPGVVHELVFPRPLVRHGITYRRIVQDAGAPRLAPPWGQPFVTGLAAWIRYPVRRLELVVRRGAGAPPLRLLPHAWPARLVVEPGEPHPLWDALYPQAPSEPAVLDAGEARLVVERPMLATCHGWEWTPAGADDLAGLPDARRLRRAGPVAIVGGAMPFPRLLSRARRRAGLSRRELARSMGVSAATVVELERGGRAPRLSTVVAARGALPSLSPHAILGSFDERAPCSRAEAWGWHRDAFSLESDEEVVVVRIAEDGTCTYTSRVLGLRWLPREARALRLRHGLSATHQGLAAPRLLNVKAGAEDEGPTIRVVRRETGALVHEVSFAAEQAGRRVSYERELAAARPLPMTEEHSPMFLVAAPFVPTRRLRLELRFPRGLFPRRHVAGCSPEVMLALRDGTDDLVPLLHPDGQGWKLVSDRRRGLLAIVADLPLLGVTHAIGIWPLAPTR